jgi:hypothetical protein
VRGVKGTYSRFWISMAENYEISSRGGLEFYGLMQTFLSPICGEISAVGQLMPKKT